MSRQWAHPYSSVSAIIFDVDNTLYKQTPGLFAKSEVAFCKSIRDHFGDSVKDMDDKQMMMLGWRSLKEHGDASAIFAAIPGGDHCSLHRRFHQYWPEDSIEPIAGLREQLHSLLAKGIQLFAYSDAHQDWTRRALKRMTIDDIIPPENVLTRDQLPCFSTKPESSRGFEKLKQQAGLEPQQMLMVDDSPKNLMRAKALGMVTVYITHGKPADPACDTYDYCYDSVTDFIADFLIKRQARAVISRPSQTAHSSRFC